MSQRINQPSQSVRLTNVAVVRINKGGKRFEIACYRNKVMNYRQGLETDLSEVLQTDRIFTNVSKGQFANSSQLQEAFGTTNQEDIAVLILQKGVLQVSDKERQNMHESTMKEIANWIAANCVNPASGRPYTPLQVQDAMKQVEFRVHATKSVKAQYLECVKLLQKSSVLQIERAKMELCLDCTNLKDHSVVLDDLKKLENVNITSTDANIVVLVDPSLYRDLSAISKKHNVSLEIKRQVVTQEGDANLDVELQRKKEQRDLTRDMEKLSVLDNVQQERQHEDAQYNDTNPRNNQKKQQQKSKKARRREQAALEKLQKQQEQQQDEEESSSGQQNAAPGVSSSSTTKSCNTCGGSFDSATQYRAHFRTDWHRYNVKLKMKGMAAISEQEFKLCDADAFFSEETV